MTDTTRAAPDNSPLLVIFVEECARLADSERQLYELLKGGALALANRGCDVRAGMNAANPITPEAVKKRRKAD